MATQEPGTPQWADLARESRPNLLAGRPAGRPARWRRTGSPDVVWMYATDDAAALYSRMGFERILVHESLADG